MKTVTDLFKESCNKDLVSSQYKIYVGFHRLATPAVALYKEDFVEQSMSISAKATSSSSFTIGGVCSTKLSLTLTQSGVDKLKRANFFKQGVCWRVIQWNLVDDPNQDKTNYTQNVDGSENTSGKCNLGVFYVSSIKNNDYSCNIEAYDGMLAFDRSVNAAALKYMQTNKKTIEDWLVYIVKECNKFYYNIGYILKAGLVNTDLPVSISEDVQIETFREALGYLSSLCGGFATFDELGNLVIRKFDYIPTALTMSHKRLLNGKFDSEVSSITQFYSSVAGFDYSGSYSGDKGNNINKVDIYVSENPFLRGIQPYNSAEMDAKILTALGNISDSILGNDFYGCDITLARLPYIDLGDCISVERVLVDKTGVSTTIVDSNIVVCDYTYNIGSNMSIKSYSTGGTSTSSSSGSVGSEPKVKADEDERVTELIDAFSEVKYEEKIVQIPITYDKPSITDTEVLTYTDRVDGVVSFHENEDTGDDWYERRQDLRVRVADFTNPRGVVVPETSVDTEAGADLLTAYNLSGSSTSILSYITDSLDTVDNIELSLDFSAARKATGVKCISKNAPLVVYYVEGGLQYVEDASLGTENDPPGSTWYTCNLDNEDAYVSEGLALNWWLSPPRSNGLASINFNFDDGNFVKYGLDEDRALFSCTLSGSFDAKNISASGTSYRGSVSESFSTSKIHTDVFMREGSNAEVNTGVSGISKTYTLDEFKSVFGNGENLQVRIGSNFVTDWNAGSGDIVGFKTYGDSHSNISRKGIILSNVMSNLSTQAKIGTYGFYIQPNDVDPSYTVVYDNLPEYATLKYRIKIETPKDINAVIDAINQGVASNADVQALKEAVDALAISNDDLTTRVADLETTVGTYDARITDATTQVAELTTLVGTYDARITDATNKVAELTTLVGTYDTRITEATNKTDELAKTVATYDARITEATNGVSELSKTVSTYDARITAATTKVDELATTVSSYDERITKATNDVAALSSSVTSLSTTVSSLSASLDKHIADANALFSSLDARITALENGVKPEPDPEPVVPTLAVTDIWFEDKNGYRFGNDFMLNGVYYIALKAEYRVCITVNEEQTVNTFFIQPAAGNAWEQFGAVTEDIKSTVTDNSRYNVQQGYKVSVSKDTATVESSAIYCSGYYNLNSSGTSLVEGTTGTVTVKAEKGLPSVGLGEYKYQFWYATGSSESSKVAMLRDWSVDNVITVEIGSAEVGGLSPVYIRWYVTDGYQTDSYYKQLTAKV